MIQTMGNGKQSQFGSGGAPNEANCGVLGSLVKVGVENEANLARILRSSVPSGCALSGGI